jgi:hypothetical protein
MLGEKQEETIMERGFCVFTDTSGHQPVTTSLIFFDKDHAVSVQGTLDQVITKLRDAYN